MSVYTNLQEDLKNNPEFYNTITNNCTNSIARHANAIVPGRIPSFAYQLVLPGYSDKLAYKIGLIDTTLPWEEVRDYFYINSKVIL